MSGWWRQLPGYGILVGILIWCDFRCKRRSDQAWRQFYREFFGANDLVFDVGANMGARSRIFLQLGAHVVAFEPQQGCVDYLRRAVGRHRRFTLITKALGDREGKARLLVGDTHVISTLSPDWQAATAASGRFGAARWSRSQEVEVMTLARAIEMYGEPRFIKIDVEGFEYQVVSTLTRPVPALSVEFTAEFLQGTLRCIEHFEAIAEKNLYQLSLGERQEFFLPAWVPVAELRVALNRLPEEAWGDLYVRMCNEGA